MNLTLPAGVQINAPILPGFETILTKEALELVARLHRAFEPRRRELLSARAARAKRLDAGERPGFLAETKAIREGDWTIAALPKALERRRVEITGPVERKMMINALNSGARVFMADFEDANSPTWENCIDGQRNLTDALDRTRDLAAAVEQVGRRRGDAPVALADGPRRLEEAGPLAGIERCLALAACGEQVEPGRVQLAMQQLEKCERLAREHLAVGRGHDLGAAELHVTRRSGRARARPSPRA